MNSSSPLYVFEDVSKSFDESAGRLAIFEHLHLRVEEGEALAIVGASGSGKSTLLHLMGALDTPTSGRVLFEGRDLGTLAPDAKARFRNEQLGFVFQFHHLLPEFSTLENVAMQAIIGGMPRGEAMRRAEAMLERVGMSHRLRHKATTLSGGERQRAAIARAVLCRPRVLLADEPTGNLDENTGAQVGALLSELNKEMGMTLVVVTHNRELADQMGRSLELRSGVLYDKTSW
ncbi:MAG: ABC transporter ATP-binding protein [Desulfovibrionaceae bacterium]|nr:ABC transporter ATP-binding protein [Desulfovibrionaceae bacterium]